MTVDLIVSVFFVLAISLQCLVAGRCLMWRLGLSAAPHDEIFQQNVWLFLALALGAGWALDILVLTFLGAIGRLHPSTLVIAILMISGLLYRRMDWCGIVAASISRLSGLAMLIGIVATLLFALRVPGHFDDTLYHLPLSRHYAEAGNLALMPYVRFPLFPQNGDLWMSLGYLFFGSTTKSVLIAQLLATWPLIVTGLGLVGVAQWLIGAAWPGFVAFALLFGRQPVKESLGFAYIDIAFMGFCWLAVLALALSLAYENNRTAWRRPMLWLAALMAGLALGTKLFAVVFVFLLWLGLAARKDWRGGSLYAVLVFLTGGFWYLRSWWISGDPIHPAGGSLFGHFLWNADDLLAQHAEQGTHGYPKSLAYIWPVLKKNGVLLFAAIPFALIFWQRMNAAIRLMLGVTGGYFFFWFYVTQVDRYLAPVLPMGLILVFWVLAQIGRRMAPHQVQWQKSAWGLIGAGLVSVVAMSVPLLWSIKQVRMEMPNWQSALNAKPGYALIMKANSLAQTNGARFLNLGFEELTYFYDGVAIGDWFGPGRYSQFANLDDPALVQRQAKALNADILVVNTRRFPINQDAYRQRFNIQIINDDGLVMTLR